MTAKVLRFHREAREKVCAGLNILANAVKVDLTKVTRLGLQNAASIASLVLTTDCIIAERPKGRHEEEDALAEA